MNWTEAKIKKLSTDEYMKNRDSIRKYYENKRLRKKQYDARRNQKKKKLIKQKIKKYFLEEYKDGRECKECLTFKFWNEFPNIESKICTECENWRMKYRLHTNYNFKLIHNLRKRIYRALKGITKTDTTKDLIGCTIKELRDYLQSKFQEGMSWENYGRWHIDHIIPCAKFDLSKPEEQRKCFHYTNLQPLWAIDNLKKNKY